MLSIKRLIIICLIVAVPIALGFLAYPKIDNLRYRFQRLERKLDVLEAHVGNELQKYQATRGETVFAPPTDSLSGTWELIGGEGVKESWRAGHFEKTRAFTVHEGRLFTGLVGPDEGDAQVWAFDDSEWMLVGGGGANGSWNHGWNVNVLISDRGAIYAGIGGSGGAEIWRFRAGAWERIGQWPAQFFTTYSLTVYQGNIIAGMAASEGGKAAIFRFDDEAWTDISPDMDPECGIVYELFPHAGYLYAGMAGCGNIYRYGGAEDDETWEKVGGDGVRGSWINDSMSYVLGFATYQDRLVASLSRLPSVSGDFTSIWAFDGAEWKPVGRHVPSLWSEFHNFNYVINFREHLLVGAGGAPPGNASIWEWNQGWQHFAGHGKGWSRMTSPNMEYVYRMIEFNGALIVGFGDGPGMAQVWQFTPN